MSKRLLQIDFSFTGPWGTAMTEAMRPMAEEIAGEPGLIWKIWTADKTTSTAGGIYLFSDQASLDHYLIKHTTRLAGFGITQINVKMFYVPADLNAITRAPV